jgi:hypothetical protein
MKTKIKIMLVIMWICLFWVSEAKENYKVFDEKVNKFCDYYGKWFKKEEVSKCKLLWQSQMRFENGKVWNNLYNFKSIKIKEEWKKVWVIGIKKNFLLFKDKSSSIKFFVDRYYKIDYRKTIRQVIAWWCYYNLKKKYVCFDGFTLTKEDQENYINYILNFKK